MAIDDGMDATDGHKKTHRKPRAGRKAEKKNSKARPEQDLTAKQRNPKAFAINSAVTAERRFRRHQDLDTKKQHIPLVDRNALEPPPIVIAVVGPPKVGKSTLIRAIIRNFTRQPLTTVKGPVTLVAGKKRRMTLIECNNDINSMIDLAKVADLVLLLIDGSFGFEMEIFEFLNICQVHGMPKVMGVLTHLDMLRNSKSLKHAKKTLKHRFWTEVYAGAKLFYLSGALHGEYLRNEIERLCRFISVIKFRPLAWQTSHPYVLVDRMEDLTSAEEIRKNSKCDRIVSLYGYVRGTAFNQRSNVHIPGCGDHYVSESCFLTDPCPLPDKLKKRRLVDTEKLIYAPFCGVGGIVYDKDAVYVEMPSVGRNPSNENNEEEVIEKRLFSSLADAKDTLNEKLEHSELQIFSNAEPIVASQFIQENDTSTELHHQFEMVVDPDGRKRRKILFEGGCSNDEENDENESMETDNNDSEEEGNESAYNTSDDDNVVVENKESSNDDIEDENITVADDDINEDMPSNDSSLFWKSNLQQKAADAFIDRQNSIVNLWKLVYDYREKKSEEETVEENEQLAEGLFKIVSLKQQTLSREKDVLNAEDVTRFSIAHISRDWSSDQVCEGIRNYFVTGKWKSSEDADTLLALDDADDADVYGDFEDFETGEKYEKGGEDDKAEAIKEEKTKREMTKVEIMEKKRNLKQKFNAEYDEKDGDAGAGSFYDELKEETSKQAELNRKKFENLDDDVRVELEGYRPGMYVRMEFASVPCELVTNFDATYPLIVGGLQPGEENIGYVNVRIKKHRWYGKILKTKDPIIMSLGWRRFQTLPVYYKLEDNFRHRMLKYTPEHVTCMANFWGPLTKPGTGFLAVQDVASKLEGFRIVATGTVVDTNQVTQITKKLKLVGEPLKIYKKTAFIKNMFTSSLEVAKFEGARIRTVSGIRGQIKRSCGKPEGSFRATFEDVIRLSDIVFCRTWCSVDVAKLYNPVTSLLLPANEKNKWRGMKTTGQLKRERGIRAEPQLDSLYKPVSRKKKIFKKLVIPNRLQKELPYKDKPKSARLGKANNLKKQRIAVIREKHEYKVQRLMRMLRTTYSEKRKRERREMRDRLKKHKRETRLLQEERDRRQKRALKPKFIARTKKQTVALNKTK